MNREFYKDQDDDIPLSVERIVRAMMFDYSRRSKLLSQGGLSDQVQQTYLHLNFIIDSALESVEIGLRKTLMEDIALHRGYDMSPCNYLVAKNTYYRRRYKVIHDVAVSLGLI